MFRYAPCISSVSLCRANDDTARTARGRSYGVSAQRFGRHLRVLRRAGGLSQEALAERCELSSDAIRRIESARFSPSLTTLSKLARGLEINLSAIFAGAERPNRPLAAELASYLDGRSAKDCELALRVVRAVFEDV
ncbi:MAG: helix-turn-helix domain-containing protein [Nannocystaceae bacterium]|nr:helix-turn-helix domain-containing protein [Nannocystaceae bacterium]